MLCFCDYRAVFSVNWDSNESGANIFCASICDFSRDLHRPGENLERRFGALSSNDEAGAAFRKLNGLAGHGNPLGEDLTR